MFTYRMYCSIADLVLNVKQMCWLCRRSLRKRGRLDAVYEKSITTVININPLMCHHVECERSGEWLKCRCLAVTICLFIKIKCMLPMVGFLLYILSCVCFLFCFDFVCPLLDYGHLFIFILQYIPPYSALALPSSLCLSCFLGVIYWNRIYYK